jgi:hypothetical protein
MSRRGKHARIQALEDLDAALRRCRRFTEAVDSTSGNTSGSTSGSSNSRTLSTDVGNAGVTGGRPRVRQRPGTPSSSASSSDDECATFATSAHRTEAGSLSNSLARRRFSDIVRRSSSSSSGYENRFDPASVLVSFAIPRMSSRDAARHTEAERVVVVLRDPDNGGDDDETGDRPGLTGYRDAYGNDQQCLAACAAIEATMVEEEQRHADALRQIDVMCAVVHRETAALREVHVAL